MLRHEGLWLSEKVVRRLMVTRPDAELVNTMLDIAVETLNTDDRPMIHSDNIRFAKVYAARAPPGMYSL